MSADVRTLVMKFGGAAVASPDCFGQVADIILNRCQDFGRVLVVVSAMKDHTDGLIAMARSIHAEPPKRELDMLITVGERVSASLLSMALWAKGKEAVSFTGSQAGLITCARHSDARIVDVRPRRILPHLAAGRVVIVAGFQGVSEQGEITTLGRGGSDTTAVALAAALSAEKVEFFKDVRGIYEKNPKKYPGLEPFRHLDYSQALDIVVASGSKVLHPRCLELARSNSLRLHVMSFKEYSKKDCGTVVEGRRSKNESSGVISYEQPLSVC